MFNKDSKSSSGGGNSFTIIQTDAGTSPTATSSSDTLTFTSSDSSVTITGNSATDTVNFTVAAGSGAPANATYVTLSTDATLTSERVLTAGSGISLVDGGAGSTITVASTITQYTDEMAQDSIGGILADTSTIDFTYNDAGNTITADIVAGSITNTHVNAAAAIARSKVAVGTADHVVINSGTGALSSEANLSVVRGGTGLGTLTANNLIVGAGTSNVTFIAPGTSGNILQSNGTTWASTSLSSAGVAPNNLTYMTISNESATLANSRRISVNATNLVGTDGGAGSAYTINTIQDIDTSATPTFQRLILTGSTNQNFINGNGTLDGTANEVAYTLAYTTNHAVSGNDTGLLISMTDTASVGTSLPLDIQVGGVSKVSVTEDGKLTTTSLAIDAFTTGSVLFIGSSSTVAQDNTNFFWDDTNNRLGIGTATPSYPLHVSKTDTSTSGTLILSSVNSVLAPASNSTSTAIGLDVIVNTSTGASNPATTILGSRYAVFRNATDTGSVTLLRGIQLQALNTAPLGTGSGAVTTLEGANIQAFDNSSTTTATTSIIGGTFTASLSSNVVASRVITNLTAGLFQIGLAAGSTSTTVTTGRVIYVDAATTGTLARTGTYTNAYGVHVTGWTTAGVFGSGLTFTNPPEQIHLDSMSISGSMGIRQVGSTPHNRLNGGVVLGADQAITSGYVLDVVGNATYSSTIFNFTTLTSLTFQDALARARLYMDATTTKIQTVPVLIQPTADVGSKVSLTTTCPAHTGISTELHELVIDMSSNKTLTNGVTIANQRSLYIQAPEFSGDVTTTIGLAATVSITGTPTVHAGSPLNITTAVGFLLEQVTIPSNVTTGIGFLIYAPISGGASTVSCGSFLDGNVGIGSSSGAALSPKTFLDIRVDYLTTARNALTCIDGTTRYPGVYIGGTILPTLNTSSSGQLIDFGWSPTGASAGAVSGSTILFYLDGAQNMTGNQSGLAVSVIDRGTGGTVTSARGLTSTFRTETGATRAITTGRAAAFAGSINGTGTVTTFVGADFTYSSANVAVTTTTGHYIRLQNPSKGASATTTNWDSILIEDGTMTVGTRYCALRVLGTTHHSRHVPDIMFGSDAAPGATVDVNGKFFVAGATGLITKYNNIVTVSGGVPAIYGTADITAQTAAKADTTLYTPTATRMFRITAALKVTTAATTSSTLGPVTIKYTSGDGSVAQTITMALATSAGAIATTSTNNSTTTSTLSGELIIYAATSVAITYAVGYASSGATAMQYSAHLKCEAM